MDYLIYFLLKTTEICFPQLKSECLSCSLEKMKWPVDCGLGGRMSRGQRAEGDGDSGKASTVSHPLQVCLSACCNPRDSQAQLLPTQDVLMSEIPLQAAVPGGILVFTKTYPDPIIQPSFQNTFEFQVHLVCIWLMRKQFWQNSRNKTFLHHQWNSVFKNLSPPWVTQWRSNDILASFMTHIGSTVHTHATKDMWKKEGRQLSCNLINSRGDIWMCYTCAASQSMYRV